MRVESTQAVGERLPGAQETALPYPTSEPEWDDGFPKIELPKVQVVKRMVFRFKKPVKLEFLKGTTPLNPQIFEKF